MCRKCFEKIFKEGAVHLSNSSHINRPLVVREVMHAHPCAAEEGNSGGGGGRNGLVASIESASGARLILAGLKGALLMAHGGRHYVDFLNLVNLAPLMELSSGSGEIAIGLMDGPVAANHPDLAAESVREAAGEPRAGCAHSGNAACTHGSFTAGILSAKRGSPAPAICPGCTLLVRPIFKETDAENGLIKPIALTPRHRHKRDKAMGLCNGCRDEARTVLSVVYG